MKPPRAPYHPHDVLTTSDLCRWLKKSDRTIDRMGFRSFAPGRYLFAHVLERVRELARARGAVAAL